MKEDKEETARWEAGKRMEDPADISGISMEMREQRLGRVDVTQFDAAEPPPDMSGFKMTTIREGDSAGFRVFFVVACVVVFIAVMALLCVQYGRALESCHSDGTTRVPLTGCR